MTTKPDDGGPARTLEQDGGPAFPVMWSERSGIDYSVQNVAIPGMSMRDYFAGQALPAVYRECIDRNDNAESLADIATEAYVVADAMLKARQQ